jgi:ABC-2 type transport system permease protein
MISNLRSEWLKVRTLRVHLLLAVLAVLLPLAVTGLFTGLASEPESIGGDDLVAVMGAAMAISLMLVGVSALLAVSAEYGYNTVRVTYAATPRRWKVVVAKLVVNSFVATVTIGIAIAVTWVVGSTILSQRDGEVALADGEDLGITLAAMVIVGLVFAWFGTGLGLLIRNSAMGVTLLVLWPLLLENIITLVASLADFDQIVRWLPLQMAIGAMSTAGSTDAFAWPWSVLWPLAFGGALVAIGLFVDSRRDA